MSTHDDVIVIGGGAPGEHAAGALAEGGLRVALVERELVGGACSYWACIPSKTLLRPGEAVQAARDAAASAEVDVEAALAWRDFMVSDSSDAGQERRLADHGIDPLRGSGRLAGPCAVEVDGVREIATTQRVADGVVTAHRVVIVGGGFGGLQAALKLRRAPVEITLIDRRNSHLFQPLTYQVATGALSPGEVAYPLRAVFKHNRNVRVLLAEVERFDLVFPFAGANAGVALRHPLSYAP